MTISDPILCLAPLRGVTDSIFRNAYEECFAPFDLMLTPFVTTVKGEIVNKNHLRDVKLSNNDVSRVVPQIIGNNPQEFIILAKTLADLGYHSVNWNMGCPYPMVTKKKRGSGLLPYPDLVRSILDSVVPFLTCSLSIKVRLGLEGSDDLERLIPIFNEYPLTEIIIHPRTGKQMYEGPVDLEKFESIYRGIKAPVVYNGDIVTRADLDRLRKRFPEIRSWMIGRGCIINPFIIPSIRESRAVFEPTKLKRFLDLLLEGNREILCGQHQVLGKMKEVWFYLYHSFHNGHKHLKAICKINSIEQYEEKIISLIDSGDLRSLEVQI